MKRTVIIGSGNLAEALARAIDRSSLQLVQIFSRNARRAEEVARLSHTAAESDPARLADADIYIIAVSDRAIAEVAASLPLPPSAVVAHTSGSTPLEALPDHMRRAVFYPLQTYTKGREVDFGKIPIFIEAESEELRNTLRDYALHLSDKVIFADSATRGELHLAAVMVCNFTNQMYALGEEIAARSGLGFEVLKPLIEETTAKALAAASPRDVQTGPAVRGDLATQQRHCKLLEQEPLTLNIYKLISQSIWETSKKI